MVAFESYPYLQAGRQWNADSVRRLDEVESRETAMVLEAV